MGALISNLEATLDHTFTDREFLNTALMHCSVGQPNNERLEYLGDAVLELIITDAIFHQFSNATEGQLTRLRASLVNRDTLAMLARSLDLGMYIKLGPGERKNSGEQRDSILADTFEAIIGAIYLDAGIKACTQCVLYFYHELLHRLSLREPHKDSKTILQELLQSRQQKLPIYKVLSEGNARHPIFIIACIIPDQGITTQAEAKSKRIAEQLAAAQALAIMPEILE